MDEKAKRLAILKKLGILVFGLFFGFVGLNFMVGQFFEFSKKPTTEIAQDIKEKISDVADIVPRRDERLENIEKAVYALVENAPKYDIRTYNLTDLMKQSEAGQTILDYISRVNVAADKAINDLNTFTSRKNLPAETAQINEINRQRRQIVENGNKFFRQLLDRALTDYPLDPKILLIESSRLVLSPQAIDITSGLVLKMAYLKPQLPNVPEFKIKLPEVKETTGSKKSTTAKKK